MTTQTETVETRRKRLLWRASHRGTREMDLILGGFARRHMEGFTQAELDEFETIVDLPDPQLTSWIMGGIPVPQGQATATLKALLAFKP